MMSFAETQPVAWAVFVLMLVAISGLLLAGIKIKGVGLGVTGVLFAGILAGHFGLRIDHVILDFVRDFGLILFVFTIGLQLGPGFFASLRQQGLKLNFVTAVIVLLGGLVAAGVVYLAGVNVFAALGLFSGATTNTPSLGATQQMLKSLAGHETDNSTLPALAYAIAYPGGVFGIIAMLLLIRVMFPGGRTAENEQGRAAGLTRMNIIVTNAQSSNVSIGEISKRTGVVISRIKKKESSEVEMASEQTLLQSGDIVLAVGSPVALKSLCDLLGQESGVNLLQATGHIVSERIVVTRKQVLGKTLAELELESIYGVAVTRITRAEIEMTALRDLRLQFGDVLQVVGAKETVEKVAKVFGNRVKALQETNFLPIFIGIALGVLIGSLPITLPRMPVPVSLGLAGGPLILAILLARIGHIGSLIWYMPMAANRAFREFGIVLFLACVGLKAGDKFFSILFSDEGLSWLLAGLLITLVPLFIGSLLARLVLKLDLPTISGLLSGSMTDPPALAFAHAITKSDTTLVAYATVYPLAMLLRIFTAQILVLIFCG
ncbi:MAG TPA: putative transporter [Verrucomicrobiae bacterium]|nr:putative transporter [Verrucomicrobiae bacterium]